MNADKLQYDASEQSLKDVTEYIKSASGGIIRFVKWKYLTNNEIILKKVDWFWKKFPNAANCYGYMM